jgi:hypothetical protein
MKFTCTYVYESCTVLGGSLYTMHCMCGLELVRVYAANAVEYCTFVYCILQFNEQYNTAFNNTARSNIATFAYRTRTVFNTEINDYWYYYRVGTGTAKVWEKPITAADDRLRINGI